jgi:RNA ligase (TIGR02306 family)
MSDFSVNVVKIDSVEDHPNADRLSLVKIAGYICIANKLEDGSARYKAGDLVVYIPEASLVPDWLLKKMNFWKEAEGKGTLHGSQGNRVRAIKLRGIVSQGILYAGNQTVMIGSLETPNKKTLDIKNDLINEEKVVFEGSDVSEFLGIIKYEPPIPQTMRGDVVGKSEYALKYDFQNIQKYNRVFEPGEEVTVQEKIHGTLCCLAYIPGMNNPELLDREFFASSKGLLAKGLYLKNNEANANNLYHRFLLSKNPKDDVPMQEILIKISKYVDGKPIYMFGELFGKGIQDLTYGCEKATLRVFDIFVGMPSVGRFLNHGELEYVLHEVANLDRVPVLYVGPFSMEKMTELRDGNTYIDAKFNQIREGIVITPTIERENQWTGRTKLKFVSPDYLLRKNGTEFN